jgi:hypothetical protein
MKTYYIYHIPTYRWKSGKIGKVGCTDDLKNRMSQYPKNTVYEVLEFHSDIYVASDREILLQRRYGYPVDTKPYWKVIQIATKASRSKGGKKNVESGHLKSIQSMGGKIGGKISGRMNVESGHLKSIQSMGGKIGGKKCVESGHMAIMIKKANEVTRKPIIQYHKDGTFIREWGSGVEAARALNLHQPNINKVCKGKGNHTGGFVFKYKEDNVC